MLDISNHVIKYATEYSLILLWSGALYFVSRVIYEKYRSLK